MRPKPDGFSPLRIAGAEGVHFAPPMTQELQRQMAESTNANYSDPGKRTDIMLDDRIEYGYSPTEKRPSGTMIDTVRDRRRPYPMATNMGCKRTMSSYDRLFEGSAMIVVTR